MILSKIPDQQDIEKKRQLMGERLTIITKLFDMAYNNSNKKLSLTDFLKGTFDTFNDECVRSDDRTNYKPLKQSIQLIKQDITNKIKNSKNTEYITEETYSFTKDKLDDLIHAVLNFEQLVALNQDVLVDKRNLPINNLLPVRPPNPSPDNESVIKYQYVNKK